MPDIFDTKNISPMLLTESRPFDSTEHIYELKLDGIRALAYLDGTQTELRNKRNKRLNDIYPELSGIYKQVKRRCILDGELVVLTNGKPDFFELQRRSLMSKSLRVEMAAKKKPVHFVAFDILYLDDAQTMEKPLMERKEMLATSVTESDALAVSRFIHDKGIEYYNLAAGQELEGIVAKRKTSLYFPAKRTKDWVKFKLKHDADLVICGYVPGDEGDIRSLALGAYNEGVLVNQGSVAFGLSGQIQEFILRFARENIVPCPIDSLIQDDKTRWIRPELVCTVEFMMRTEYEMLRQPVFKGLVQDKDAKECTLGR